MNKLEKHGVDKELARAFTGLRSEKNGVKVLSEKKKLKKKRAS